MFNKYVTKRVQSYISNLSHEELAKITTKLDTTTLYDNQNSKFGKEAEPVPKAHYVHRSIIIRKGYVHFTNAHHRQMVAYYHPWMKGYLERVGKALWSTMPLFCKPGQEKNDKPDEDEAVKTFWEDTRLQDAVSKSWLKSQVHGIVNFYPMEKAGFFKGYSGPAWYVYSTDEMGLASEFKQGHPVRWTIKHSNPNKSEPKEITIDQVVFYDYKNTDDFTGEPFGIGIWDLLIDWIYMEDAVNSFDQRMGNGFLTMVVPNNTSPAEIAKYEEVIKNTRTEKGIVIKGAVDEPVELNWVGMAGMQVDFIGHMEKLEDLIAFNMGFPKRWIMGDSEGAMESSGKDALQVNIQLKNLFAEWTIYIKRILIRYNQISDLKDIRIIPPFEMQLSEQEQIELDQVKALTTASKTWLTVNEQREEDGKEPKEGGDELFAPQPGEEGVNPKEETPLTQEPMKPTTKKTDTYDQLLEVFTDSQIGIRELAQFCGVSPTTISKIRSKFDTVDNDPHYKEDDLVIKCDAVSLGDDLYEIEDVPVLLPQTKHYEDLGYDAIRPKEEIARIFNDPKYPKEYRIGATITDDHSSRVPLEVLNENTVGMVKLTRLDEDGNVRGNIRYSLKEADRILGNKNYIREKTMNNENIPTSVALYSRDRPGSHGMIERDLDVRSFVFSQNHARNPKAGR